MAHPRFSVLSSGSSTAADSPAGSVTRFSLPSVSTSPKPPSARPTIYDRPLIKTRTAEVSASAFAFLFSEMVQYTQKRVSGIADLERRLNTLGYRVGTRVLELMIYRVESTNKAPKREIRFLPALMSIHTQVWRAVFGKPADALEKSVEAADEYMIIDNDPQITRNISIPKDLSSLSCSSFTAGIVEAVLDGLGFPARVTAHNTPIPGLPNRTTILIKLDKSVVEREDALNLSHLLPFFILTTMVDVGRLHIYPSIINTSCAWAGERDEINALSASSYTGAVTTRTATAEGFRENEHHTVVFASESSTTLNSYGYSPHPLSTYLNWIQHIITASPTSQKPFIISITSSSPEELADMLSSVQMLRAELGDQTGKRPVRIAVELNTSCPNIKHAPPPSYNMPSLTPLLSVLAEAFWADETLTIGLKLPPYLYAQQFEDAVAAVASLTRGERNPISFFTCTNTLGNSLLFADQAAGVANAASAGSDAAAFALPTPLGGLAGAPLHALALGNVYSFARLLAAHPSPCIRNISIIGVGGVLDSAGADRMRRAGAKVVGCATLLGRMGVEGFATLL